MTDFPKLFLPVFVAATMAVMTGCAGSHGMQQPMTLAAATSVAPELATFYRLVQQAGMAPVLEASGPVTVFAPSDEAFKALPTATLDKLARDPDFLKAVLAQHVVPGLHPSSAIGNSQTLTTVSGTPLLVARAGDYLTVEEGLVTQVDRAAVNGLLNVVDTVLMPPKAKK